MIFFGHLGIGEALAPPKRLNVPRSWLLMGTVLPDLLDKSAHVLGLFPGTRSVGHTGLFALAVLAYGKSRKDARAAALAAGASTHLLLDVLADWAVSGPAAARAGCAAFWPLTGWAFPPPHHHTLAEYLFALKHPFLLVCEIAGLLLLLRSTPARKFDILKK